MQLDELKDKYKAAPLWARLLAAAVIGMVPAAYFYMEDSETLAAALADAQGKESQAKQQFETAVDRKKNLPKLEEQLAFTEEQLIKAKKSLPDSYRIEDILEKTATIANETHVKLMSFDPGDEQPHDSPSMYVVLPFATQIVGGFAEVAAFFDRVVHLESSIFVKNIELTRATAEPSGAPAARARPGANVDPAVAASQAAYQSAQAARQNSRVGAKFQLSIYRAMTDGETAGGVAAGTAQQLPGAAQPAGAKPPAGDEGGAG
jgi:Tfp pilus assembly protein PilO